MTETRMAADTIASLMDGVLRPGERPGSREAYLPSPSVQNHAANLMLLGDGSLGCVWFGGTQEGKADISVHMARLAPGADRWSEAVRLVDDPTRSEQNPILFPTPEGHSGCSTRPRSRATRTRPWCAGASPRPRSSRGPRRKR